MEFQFLFNIVVGIGCSGIGWFAKTLWDSHQKLREDHTALHIKVTQDYVPNSRLELIMKGMADDIKYIRNRLDDQEKP